VARTVVEANPAEQGHETILLVEDEAAILRLATRMLERRGYVVLAAGTPREALRLAETHQGEIQLLMTDVIMPEMDGHELAEILLAQFPRLKRLFMSGYTAEAIGRHGVLEAGVSFLPKPFSSGELAAKVRKVLDGD
jgi:CheY-like chemotaxis protein